MSQPEISQVIRSAQAAAEADEHYDPFKDSKRKPTRSKDPAWKYAFWPDLDNTFLLQCNLCGKKVSSGAQRMEKHLAGGFTVVSMCPKSTPEIRKEMHEYLKTHTYKFNTIEGGEEGDEAEEGEKVEASSKASNSNSSKSKPGKRKSEGSSHLATSAAKKEGKSIADQIRKTPEEVVSKRLVSKGQSSIKDLMEDKGAKRYCR